MEKEFRNKNKYGLIYMISQEKNKEKLVRLCETTRHDLGSQLNMLKINKLISTTRESVELTDSGKSLLTEILAEYDTDQLKLMAIELFGKYSESENSSEAKDEEITPRQNDMDASKANVGIVMARDTNVANRVTTEENPESSSRVANTSLGQKFINRNPKPLDTMNIVEPKEMTHVFKNQDVMCRVDFLMELMKDDDPQDIKDDFRSLALKIMRRAMR